MPCYSHCQVCNWHYLATTRYRKCSLMPMDDCTHLCVMSTNSRARVGVIIVVFLLIIPWFHHLEQVPATAITRPGPNVLADVTERGDVIWIAVGKATFVCPALSHIGQVIIPLLWREQIQKRWDQIDRFKYHESRKFEMVMQRKLYLDVSILFEEEHVIQGMIVLWRNLKSNWYIFNYKQMWRLT